MATRPNAANDNSNTNTNTNSDTDFAFNIGEDVEVMTRGVIVEQARNEQGRSYVVKATKGDRDIFIRVTEENVFEAEPVKATDVRAAA